MAQVSLNDFFQETECTYKGEHYSVRDNGAVLRHPREGKRPRPKDSKWTFGKVNIKTGYMEIVSVRVHRIVATAFHGEPPTPEHVVDHIDTNRQNNRPENLRWLTRLENALKNPITRKRIEGICGSIEAFMEDPSILGHSKLDLNFQWMRTVTPEEAKSCRERLEQWAKSDKVPSGGSIGEWVYTPLKVSNQQKEAIEPVPPRDLTTPIVQAAQEAHRLSELVMAQTSGAAQRNWKIPSEFPCCPDQVGTTPIKSYLDKLQVGAVFSRNDIVETVVLEVAALDDEHSLLVMCEQTKADALKPWSLAKVSYEDGLFIHTSLGNFFDKQGANKQFHIEQGLEWTGGDSIDDYC